MNGNVKVESVPKQWPGAFGLLKYSKEAVAFNIWTVLGLCAAWIVVSWLVGAIFGVDPQTKTPSIAAQFVSLLLSPIFAICIITTLFAGIKRKKLVFSDTLKAVEAKLWLNVLLQNIVVGLILAVSVVLLVVPFFFVFPRLVLAPFIVIDKKTGALEAIQQSWELTRSHVGKIYGIVGANIAFALIAVTIIGIPVTLYLLVAYVAAYPLLYRYLTAK